MSYQLIPAPAVLRPLPGVLTVPLAEALTASLDGPADLGREGYLLDVGAREVRLLAHAPEGLYRGRQTLRQLGPGIPCLSIEDRPRYAWRGVMLDVARHFFPVETVLRFIDLVEPYKINVLHLHLTDDQGWRLAIDSWPELTGRGAATQVGGGPGGFYGKDDFRRIVAYAAERHIAVVPEIDLPGHTNAALASYGELTASGEPAEPYTGTRVGFSGLPADREITYRFVADVLTEVAGLTPSGLLHIGGDEAHSTPAADYATFLGRVREIVADLGMTLAGWQEIATVPLAPGSVVQYWRPGRGEDAVRAAAAAGARVVMSPADRVYLDMKYDAATPLGLDWMGYVPARRAYDWDPAGLIDGVGDAAVLGVEAPLWTETLATLDDLAVMLLPRLACVAEVGWSPAGRSWEEFAPRLAAHAAGWPVHGPLDG